MAKAAKSGLGRGLDSLLGGAPEEAQTSERKQGKQVTSEKAPTPARERIVVEAELPADEIVEIGVPTHPRPEKQKASEKDAAKAASKEAVEELTIQAVIERKLDEVPLSSVVPNPDQPRTNFKPEEIEELAASIEKDGLLQPILVRATGPQSYQIIAGERRWQACRKLGLKTIPVRIKEANDDKALELALIENVQRSDLNPIEEAYGYRRLMERCKMTQSDVAQAMSKGRSTVANALRLLELPEDAQQLLFEEKITAGHARAILSIPTKEGRKKLTEKMKAEQITVREAEAIARLLSGKKPAAGESSRTPLPPSYKKVARELKDILHTNVRVKSSKGKNKIEIEFKDESELERLFVQLTGSEEDK